MDYSLLKARTRSTFLATASSTRVQVKFCCVARLSMWYCGVVAVFGAVFCTVLSASGFGNVVQVTWYCERMGLSYGAMNWSCNMPLQYCISYFLVYYSKASRSVVLLRWARYYSVLL